MSIFSVVAHGTFRKDPTSSINNMSEYNGFYAARIGYGATESQAYEYVKRQLALELRDITLRDQCSIKFELDDWNELDSPPDDLSPFRGFTFY